MWLEEAVYDRLDGCCGEEAGNISHRKSRSQNVALACFSLSAVRLPELLQAKMLGLDATKYVGIRLRPYLLLLSYIYVSLTGQTPIMMAHGAACIRRDKRSRNATFFLNDSKASNDTRSHQKVVYLSYNLARFSNLEAANLPR